MSDTLRRSIIRLRRLGRFFELGNVSKWVLFAALIGCTAGLVAVGFRWLIHMITDIAFRAPTGLEGEGAGSPAAGLWDYWYLILAIPTLGGLATGWLTQTFAPEAEGHGTDSVIRAFHRLRGAVRRRVILLKALTSAITIGSGGSAGQEGPVAQVGAGVGSALADSMKLSQSERRIFLLSGASAGIGAMFASPLGGALFMPEVLYRKAEFEGEAIIPCIISSIFAFATFTFVSGTHQAVVIDPDVLAALSFDDPRQLPIYLFLALVCALVGWMYTRSFYGTHNIFSNLTAIPKIARPALGGFLLGALALAIAPLAGEGGIFFGGYDLMLSSIEGGLTIPILLALILAKILATSLSISSGGSGGVFAPSLAIGALVGAAVGQAGATVFPGLGINPACFALVGMGGFFAGVAKVPVAAVIMVCEMTGGYALLAPLMLVAVVHVMLSNRWSLYEAQVPGMVNSPAHAGDFVVDVLEDIQVSEIMREVRAPAMVHERDTLRQVMRVVSDSKETHFPVIDVDERLVGIFSLTDLRRIFLEDVVEDMVIVRDFMVEHVITVTLQDNLHEVLRRMTRFNINAIPVVDSNDPRKVVALLERNELGRAYDERLAELKEDGLGT